MGQIVAGLDCVRLRPDDVELAKDLPLEPFSVLWRASQYARNIGSGLWQFAVEMSQLRQAGLSECDLRWLTCKGFVEHSSQHSSPAAKRRSFGDFRVPRFSDQTEFVLTSSGRLLAQALMESEPTADALDVDHAAMPPLLVRPAAVPLWDCQRRELRLGRTVVKRFSVPAENQETILTAFEEEAWTVHIDDPLPPADGIDPKRRLHSAIQCLNRNQQAHMVNFHGDGTGCGVRWELLPFPSQT